MIGQYNSMKFNLRVGWIIWKRISRAECSGIMHEARTEVDGRHYMCDKRDSERVCIWSVHLGREREREREREK
jgi:hypothetical protein